MMGYVFIVVLTIASALPNKLALLSITILLAALCVSFMTDLRYGLIFDAVTFPCSLLLALIACLQGTILQTVLGGAVCAGIILTLFILSGGRGIGLGDLKLAGCIGLGLGMEHGILALGMAFIAGGLHGAILLVLRRVKMGHALKFAPYLAFGSAFAIAASWMFL
jgi:prepilin signal peptidase PulO-like enzyme (type II secretory pathway)